MLTLRIAATASIGRVIDTLGISTISTRVSPNAGMQAVSADKTSPAIAESSIYNGGEGSNFYAGPVAPEMGPSLTPARRS